MKKLDVIAAIKLGLQACIFAFIILIPVSIASWGAAAFGYVLAEFGLIVGSAIGVALCEADARAEKRSNELNHLISKWMSAKAEADTAYARRQHGLGHTYTPAGPPLLPQREPLQPGRRFNVLIGDKVVAEMAEVKS